MISTVDAMACAASDLGTFCWAWPDDYNGSAPGMVAPIEKPYRFSVEFSWRFGTGHLKRGKE